MYSIPKSHSKKLAQDDRVCFSVSASSVIYGQRRRKPAATLLLECLTALVNMAEIACGFTLFVGGEGINRCRP